MKSLLLVTLLLTTNAYADSKKFLDCEPDVGYFTPLQNLRLDIESPGYLHNGVSGENEDVWLISWSASECEDSTEVSFNKKDYEDLLSGKIKGAGAWYSHTSPGATIEAEFICELKGE